MKDCDFIPADYHEARTLKRGLRRRTVFAAVMMLIMGLWVVVNRHQLSTAAAMLPELESQQRDIAFSLAEKQRLEVQRAELLSNRLLLDKLESKSSLVIVMSDISRRMPGTVVLTDMFIERPSLAKFSTSEEEEEAAIEEELDMPRKRRPERREHPIDLSLTSELRLTGIAVANPDVVRFAAAMESSPLFDRVQMEITGPTTWNGRRGQKFELTCELVDQRRDDE